MPTAVAAPTLKLWVCKPLRSSEACPRSGAEGPETARSHNQPPGYHGGTIGSCQQSHTVVVRSGASGLGQCFTLVVGCLCYYKARANLHAATQGDRVQAKQRSQQQGVIDRACNTACGSACPLDDPRLQPGGASCTGTATQVWLSVCCCSWLSVLWQRPSGTQIVSKSMFCDAAVATPPGTPPPLHTNTLPLSPTTPTTRSPHPTHLAVLECSPFLHDSAPAYDTVLQVAAIPHCHIIHHHTVDHLHTSTQPAAAHAVGAHTVQANNTLDAINHSGLVECAKSAGCPTPPW
jgi:hypothetical protein